jgi:hypothetical protein
MANRLLLILVNRQFLLYLLQLILIRYEDILEISFLSKVLLLLILLSANLLLELLQQILRLLVEN